MIEPLVTVFELAEREPSGEYVVRAQGLSDFQAIPVLEPIEKLLGVSDVRALRENDCDPSGFMACQALSMVFGSGIG